MMIVTVHTVCVGYQHVIATLWPISDTVAVTIADDLCTALDDSADPAMAVHTALRHTRALWPDRPSLWASRIHVGDTSPPPART
jgi:hypothetical protein